MSKRQLSRREWQQQLIDAYYDYRWKQLLEPLYQDLQYWKAGQRSHAEMDQALHAAHKKSQELYGFFRAGRDEVASWIQLDRDWFPRWLAEHPAPPGVHLIPPSPE